MSNRSVDDHTFRVVSPVQPLFTALATFVQATPFSHILLYIRLRLSSEIVSSADFAAPHASHMFHSQIDEVFSMMSID